MATSKPVRTSAFISYSRKDRNYLAELTTHLRYLERDGIIDYWDDTKLEGGTRWRPELQRVISSTKVAILLVSPDFLASDFIAKNELLPLLEAASREGVVILSVLLRPSLFHRTELAQFQAINAKPLSEMNRGQRAEVWVNVAEQVIKALQRPKEEWFEEGKEYLRDKQYDKAASAFKKAIDLDDDYGEAHYKRGFALVQLERYGEAIPPLEKAIRLNPYHGYAYYSLGCALAELGRYKEAASALTEALKLEPDFSEAYFSLGYALSELERYEEALLALDKAIELKPDHALAYYRKGYVQVVVGLCEEALSTLEHAIRLNPRHAYSYYSRGYALYKLGRCEEAVAAYNEAIRRKPDLTSAYYGKGETLMKLGRSTEAEEAYRKAHELEDESA